MINYKRDGRVAHRLIMIGPFGVTFWRRGALSFQACGRFIQVVIGDWWGPFKERV